VIGWWIGNAIGLLVVVPAVITLAVKILKLLAEIGRYAEDIVERGGRAAANVEPLPSIRETRQLAGAVRTAAERYADALEPVV
jgi:hypothetical protein